ncbi:MAG TPA: SPOR domain-containing protein [Steroidobacteraceae bacterium]|jgi:DedD protein|nr:SPOR domain-containing protein [Steroidobacteraceae bacterium]
MDRRVKERLVGASILAVLIVLIVPELLSGPAPVPATSRLPVSAPEPVRNVTVDLATSKAPEPPPLDAPAASSAVSSGAAGPPSAASSVPAPPASAPAASAGSTSVEIAPSLPTSSTTTAKTTAAHAWAVQLGSFVSRDNADKLARQLRAQGFSVYVLPGGSGPLLRYRVRIGPMPDRSAAAQTVAKLKSLGQVASLVPPGP